MKFKILPVFAALCCCALIGCVDDAYDLSDVDTTIRVEVEDLVVPIEINSISLGNVIEIDAGSQIKEMDGKYVIIEEGNFTTTGINVNAFTMKSKAIDSSEATMDYVPLPEGYEFDGYYEFESTPAEFSYESSDIPESVIEIDTVGGEIMLTVDMHLDGFDAVARAFEIQGVEIQLPKGLRMTQDEGGIYDHVTGIYTLDKRYIVGNEAKFHLVADMVDFDEAGGVYDPATHHLKVDGDVYLKSGSVYIYHKDIFGTVPMTININVDYSVSDFKVKTFTGRIKYDIENVEISDIVLNNLPDFLAQEETNIVLENPQLYLTVNNPVQDYNLTAQTGLTITSYHNDGSSNAYSLDNGHFTIGRGNEDGIYTYCLSPENPENYYVGFERAEYVAYTGLRNVLSGNGLPSRLGVDLDNPCLPEQNVRNFELGKDLGDINGAYMFYAPLAFGEGAKVVYTDTIDGWSSEELDGVVIETLEVRASITTNIPLALDMQAYPIDVNGNQINNVKIEGARIEGNANAQEVLITITGEVRKLDGLRFTAICTADGSETLTPDMTIQIDNLRPSVTGYYDDKL